MKKIKEIVYIEWCDAMINQSSWMSFKKTKKWADTENWTVSSIGFLLEETKEYILLANKISFYDKNNPDVGGIIKIPATWIRKRVNLMRYII